MSVSCNLQRVRCAFGLASGFGVKSLTVPWVRNGSAMEILYAFLAHSVAKRHGIVAQLDGGAASNAYRQMRCCGCKQALLEDLALRSGADGLWGL